MRRARDPLVGIDRLVVDGTNVLHALRRAPGPVPAPALVGRLRAAIDPAVRIVVVLDGRPDPGGRTRLVAAGVEVRYAGARPADPVIVELARDDPQATLVVTDDGELGRTVRSAGARTERLGWLLARLGRQRLSAPAPGRRGPPAGTQPAPTSDGDDNPRWRPGRGATVKSGNPRRPKRRRDPGPPEPRVEGS